MKHQIFPSKEALQHVVKHLFDDTYTKEEKLQALAFLERDQQFFDWCIKEIHPTYYIENPVDGCHIAKFTLMHHLGVTNTPNLFYPYSI